jgi:hypothetical protein
MLEGALNQGRNKSDIGKDIIDVLGFSVEFWNRNKVPVSVSVNCGVTSSVETIMNHFTVDLPEPVGGATDLYAPEIAKRVFRVVVESWDPLWATFGSYSLRAAQVQGAGRPIAGWLTYLSSRLGSQVELEEEEISVEPLLGGMLLTVGTDPLHLKDAHISTISKLIRSEI